MSGNDLKMHFKKTVLRKIQLFLKPSHSDYLRVLGVVISGSVLTGFSDYHIPCELGFVLYAL